MAILGIFTGDGFTKQIYEELKKAIDWDNNHPTGIIFHATGFDNLGNLRAAISGNLHRISITFLTIY
jgi:hypothetical protein